jgi:hypothetical protein
MLIVSTDIVICLLNKREWIMWVLAPVFAMWSPILLIFFSNFFLFFFISLSSGMRIDETRSFIDLCFVFVLFFHILTALIIVEYKLSLHIPSYLFPENNN